jgi:16S rRNA (cytosine1402-N4)-methyltransferase
LFFVGCVLTDVEIDNSDLPDFPGESAESDESAPEFAHIPVLAREVIEGLVIRPGGHYLDVTVGGGGHSRLILAADATVRLTALDQDEWAIAAAQKNLAEFGVGGASPSENRVQFHPTNFADYDPGDLKFDGILADLGVSSAQFDIPERGFSFRHAAALDMRMDQRQDLTAADIINTWEEVKLAEVIYKYGEERLSRQIARRIVERRPLQTTTDLSDTIFHAVPRSYRYGRIHPATRTFQALRIAVNRELQVLETFLGKAPDWLKPEGRLAVISFHSLEDRIVKHTLKEAEALRVLTKKPIVAGDEEVKANGRSRSAKLRVAERKATLHTSA